MKPNLAKILLLVTLAYSIFMTGCEDEPMGLGEAVLKTLLPTDGRWSGRTSQEKNVSFDVINQGTEIDSGFVITLAIDEWWGYGTVILERLKPLPIEDRKFTMSASSFCINGNFRDPKSCSGDFDLSGNTGYPYYLSYSTEGTWNTKWLQPHSDSLSKPNAKATDKNQYSIKQIIETDENMITITLLFKNKSN